MSIRLLTVIISIGLFNFSILFGQKEVKYISSNAGEIYYEVQGKGTPVLFLSGGPGAPPQSLYSIVDYVSLDYKCILLHQRGTGKSKNCIIDSNTITIEQYLDDITNILNNEKTDQVFLIGHSWGAILSLDFMTKYPNRVKGVILIGSSGSSLDFIQNMNNTIMSRLTKNEIDSLEFYSKLLENPETDSTKRETLTNKMNYILLSKQFYNPSLAYALLELEPINMEINYLMMNYLFKINWNPEEKLRELRLPTIIINGKNDPIGIEPVEHLQRTITGCKLQIIDNCGHYIWIEKPDELKNMILTFLNDHGKY